MDFKSVTEVMEIPRDGLFGPLTDLAIGVRFWGKDDAYPAYFVEHGSTFRAVDVDDFKRRALAALANHDIADHWMDIDT